MSKVAEKYVVVRGDPDTPGDPRARADHDLSGVRTTTLISDSHSSSGRLKRS
jgi:hypothetical protein